MTPKVYIPQVPQYFDDTLQKMVPRFDTLSQAESFGELVVLLDRNDDVWDPDEVMAKIERKMQHFTDQDYILPMGTYPFIMWTGMVAMVKAEQYVQHLQWHQRERQYRVVSLNVGKFT